MRSSAGGYAADPVGVGAHVERRPVTRHAIVAGALACGIAAGGALGLMLVDFSPDRSDDWAPGPAVVVTPDVGSATGSAPTARQALPPAPAPRQVDVISRPAAPAGGSVVVDVPRDVPAPADPGAAEPQPQPEPDPDPQPPVFDGDLPLKLPEPPQPPPVPKPPVFKPDLPKAPAPQPVPPSIPDFNISDAP